MADINQSQEDKSINIVKPKQSRPAKGWRGIAFVLMLALLGLLGWGLKKAQAGPIQEGLAPDFSITGFDEREATLSELRGQVVIVNFWASWCPPCREEAAYLEQTWRKYKDQGVVFIGVDYVDTEKEALAYIQEFDITYINGPDIGTRISQAYNIEGVPETFFIAKNGELRGVHIGALKPPQLDQKIEELLAESFTGNQEEYFMVANIGLITLVIAFAFSVYAIIASVYGGLKKSPAWVESARHASLVVFPLLTISTAAVVYSLYVLDLSLAYVYDVASHAMSNFLRITALWGGQQGSVLFWAWIMSGFIMIVLVRKWEKNHDLMPYVIAVSMLTTAFFVGVVVFITNPFARLWHVPEAENLTPAIFQPVNAMPYIPEDGQGLNPLLRHFGMIGHPPTTYIGFTGFVIPYAFAMAALITGKSRQDDWIRTTRRWTLVAWIFLTIGLVLGGRWAYDVLGWGGFWGWDPVENAMFMPWLTGTAFLHSVMMTEKRGMLKQWNMILIILTYALTLFGTFITRTGVISSVHAFTKSALGPAFFIFIGLTFLGSMSLLSHRWKSLKGEHQLESFFSREAAFVLQNMIFLAITFAVFWGTVFPLISELVTGTKITVGPAYFKKVTSPLFYSLVLLMGLAPLFAWRNQSVRVFLRATLAPFLGSLGITAVWGYLHRMHPASVAGLWLVSFVLLAILVEFWKGVQARRRGRGENPLIAFGKLINRNHRRYGGYIIHLGVVMLTLGIVGDAFFKQETQGTLTSGQSLSVAGYSLRFEGLQAYRGTDGREIVEADTTLLKNGETILLMQPRRDYFVVQEQPVTVPAVYATAGTDVYILLLGWQDDGLSATFRVYINSLINWVWGGGLMMILGTLIAAWPLKVDKKETSYQLQPQTSSPQPMVGD